MALEQHAEKWIPVFGKKRCSKFSNTRPFAQTASSTDDVWLALATFF